MIRLLMLLMVLASTAQAQTVGVKSGEHGPFTRLVFTFPSKVDWLLGRTTDGYGLRLSQGPMAYDLSSVYDLITKDRLKSIWVDPVSGDVMLGLNCECHAIPFELGSRILVIDLKDGPAPQNSSFELSLGDGLRSPPLQSDPRPRPKTKSETNARYDWLSPNLRNDRAMPHNSTPGAEKPLALEPDLQLGAFRSLLVQEIGRGATQRVVEMVPPSGQAPSAANEPTTPNSAAPELTDDPAPVPTKQVNAALESLPRVEIFTDPENRPNLTVNGATCPTAANLDIGNWANPEDGADKLASTRSGLLSEFDLPDPEKILQAVNLHLYFGFGAEARMLLTQFMPSGKRDPYRIALSHITDGEPPPQNPFLDMQSCDSAAALWALLAAPQDQLPSFVNGPAVGRTFMTLPSHLRAYLGPEVVKRLLKSGDRANAEIIKRAFERSIAPEDPKSELLEADQALLTGNPQGAEAALPHNTTGETALAALFTLIEARFQQRRAVDAKDILALESYAFEHGNGPLRPRIDRALAHATALAGDFPAAFAYASGTPMLEHDVWSLLADLGTDSSVLEFAVGVGAPLRDTLALSVRRKMAERLMQAGLPNAAQDWAQSPDIDPQLAARVALANGDARTALRIQSSQDQENTAELMASSYAFLRDFEAASAFLRASGNTQDAHRMQRWTGDWASETETEGGPWKALSDLLAPGEDIQTQPTLQAVQSQLTQSLSTREAIATLLTQTATPQPVPEP